MAILGPVIGDRGHPLGERRRAGLPGRRRTSTDASRTGRSSPPPAIGRRTPRRGPRAPRAAAPPARRRRPPGDGARRRRVAARPDAGDRGALRRQPALHRGAASHLGRRRHAGVRGSWLAVDATAGRRRPAVHGPSHLCRPARRPAAAGPRRRSSAPRSPDGRFPAEALQALGVVAPDAGVEGPWHAPW